MFCEKCGSRCPDNTAFCPNCGQRLNSPAASYPSNPQPYSSQPPQSSVTPSSILTFGILSLALSEILGLGIVFGILGKAKARTYESETGSLTGSAKVGFTLAKIGFIVSIVFAALEFIAIAL